MASTVQVLNGAGVSGQGVQLGYRQKGSRQVQRQKEGQVTGAEPRIHGQEQKAGQVPEDV